MNHPSFWNLRSLVIMLLLLGGSNIPAYAQMVRKDSLHQQVHDVSTSGLQQHTDDSIKQACRKIPARKPGDILPRKNKANTLAQSIVGLKDNVVTAVRQTGRKIRKVGSGFNAIDTNYIAPNRYNLAFMLEQSSWHEHYRLSSKSKAGIQQINLAPNPNFKMGIYFGWRWIFLGYTFDVENLTGNRKNKPKKTEMALNLYSSKFGIDLYYRKTGSDFKIRSTEGFKLNQPIKNVDFDGLHSKIRGLNAYWIFNYKQFSYPAAYSQSTNQRRSAGSFMAGFSYSQHRVLFDSKKLPEPLQEQLHETLRFQKVKYTDYSLHAGYGYNWVFAKNCVANLSLLPALAYKQSKIDDIDQRTHFIKDINFDLITRAGIVYNNSKYFIGASLVMHTYDYRKRDFALRNTFGTIRVYAGFNFWKKKEYRSPSQREKH